MTRIVADNLVCQNGFVTGLDPSPDNGLGTGGEALHTWAHSAYRDALRILCEGTTRPGTWSWAATSSSTSTVTQLTYDFLG